MYSVRVEGDFAAAHFLSHYHGKCEKLHGHNYRVRLWARGDALDEGGMLTDFGVLKKALREVLAGLDHSNLNDTPAFNNDPSAERIAKYIFDHVEAALRVDKDAESAASIAADCLWAVDVFETPTSMARYERDC
jgi:6-pyruvoyltetrahydropterin/6-carboxytetrahydropterin synthase